MSLLDLPPVCWRCHGRFNRSEYGETIIATSRNHRVNADITAPEVRFNGPENEPLGIVSLREAMPLPERRKSIWSRSPRR